jgi:hypothetical protein
MEPTVTSLVARSSRGRCAQHLRRIRGCDAHPAWIWRIYVCHATASFPSSHLRISLMGLAPSAETERSRPSARECREISQWGAWFYQAGHVIRANFGLYKRTFSYSCSQADSLFCKLVSEYHLKSALLNRTSSRSKNGPNINAISPFLLTGWKYDILP